MLTGINYREPGLISPDSLVFWVCIMGLKKYIVTILKYLFSIVLMVCNFVTYPSKKVAVAWMIELLIIAALSNVIIRPRPSTVARVTARIINDILMLLFNAQLLIFYFARTYLTLVMLTNLDSAEDITGNIFRYGLGIVLVIIFSFLPIEYISFNFKKDDSESASKLNSYRVLAASLALELVMVSLVGTQMSPIYAYADLALQKRDKNRREDAMQSEMERNHTEDFYKEEIYDNILKPEELSDNPNIVIVMAEGLSQNIIDDSRDVMPRFREFEEQGITFTNYYNHTFATYRGIIGQLYSGFQNENTEKNTLISMMDILEDRGYHTVYINVEPANETFTEYTEGLGFDEVITGSSEKSGYVKSVSDGHAYELLYSTIEKESEKETPYFIVMYTFGTHTTFDSKEEKYGDGSVAFYNKFWNADYQFGKFFDKWSGTKLADDTLFVMTADHATYGDEEYLAAFPEYGSARAVAVIDEMPLILWHKGIKPAKINANGRNTLDMAPTVLDYVDISAPNYFLGDSLFYGFGNEYDTLFSEEAFLFSTSGGNIGSIPESSVDETWNLIYNYYAAKLQEPVNK